MTAPKPPPDPQKQDQSLRLILEAVAVYVRQGTQFLLACTCAALAVYVATLGYENLSYLLGFVPLVWIVLSWMEHRRPVLRNTTQQALSAGQTDQEPGNRGVQGNT